MVYFVFDMDETLGELYTTHYFLGSLDTSSKVIQSYSTNVQNPLSESLETAYQSFIRQCAEQEMSDTPLGILRPGMIDVMRKIVKAKIKGYIKGVVIYSNSGDSFNLKFMKDIFEYIFRPETIFCDLVDWWHPLRSSETGTIAGSANKTWNVLEAILDTGACKAADVKPKDVYFFDDKIHDDLLDKLGDHYFHVPVYNYKASASRVIEIFRKALEEAHISTTPEMTQIFLKNVGKRVSGKIYPTLDQLLEVFRKYTQGTASASTLPPTPDVEPILDLLDGLGGGIATNNVVAKANHTVGATSGGYRRRVKKTRKQKKRRTVKKSRINRRR
jgi:hypothetical protein